MAYGNSTALSPVTSPVKSAVNPISGLLGGLGNNWWILIVLYLLISKKGTLSGISGLGGKKVLDGLGGLGGLLSNWWIWLILIFLIEQPSAGNPGSKAGPGGLGSLINGLGGVNGIVESLGGIDGIMNNLGGVNGIMESFGGVDGIVKNLGGIEGIMGKLGGINGLLANGSNS
jgi:hypothetical protein